MSLVYEQCVNAHIIEILYFVGTAVEHFLCLDCRILLGHGFLLFIVGGTLRRAAGQCSLFGFKVGKFLFGTSCHRVFSAGVCLSHLFKHKHLFLNLVLHELYLAVLAVRDKLKGALRHDNHVPIVVLDFGVEVLSALRIAVVVLKREYLGIGIEFLGRCCELAYGGILHHNHRLACRAESAHLHCGRDKGERLAGAYLVGEQQRLHGSSHNGLALVGAHLELVGRSSEVFGYEVLGYAHRHIVVEAVVVLFLHVCRQLCVALHLLAHPVLEVLTYLVYLGRTRCRGLAVHNGLRCAVPVLFRLRYGDGLVLNGSLDEFVAEYGLIQFFAHHAHGPVLLFAHVIWLVHKPTAADCRKLHVNVGAVFHVFVVVFRRKP